MARAGWTRSPPIASSITSCSDLLDFELAAAWRFAPGPRASARTCARSSASWQTVLVPPASMPMTSMERRAYRIASIRSPPRASCGTLVVRFMLRACRLRRSTSCGSARRCSLLRALSSRAVARVRAARGNARAVGARARRCSSPDDHRRWSTAAKAGGFNTLLVQVRGRGDAFYDEHDRAARDQLDAQPAIFDPLATAIAAGAPRGPARARVDQRQPRRERGDLPRSREPRRRSAIPSG